MTISEPELLIRKLSVHARMLQTTTGNDSRTTNSSTGELALLPSPSSIYLCASPPVKPKFPILISLPSLFPRDALFTFNLSTKLGIQCGTTGSPSLCLFFKMPCNPTQSTPTPIQAGQAIPSNQTALPVELTLGLYQRSVLMGYEQNSCCGSGGIVAMFE